MSKTEFELNTLVKLEDTCVISSIQVLLDIFLREVLLNTNIRKVFFEGKNKKVKKENKWVW
jgi:hypothetical protein